jgi:L-aminopeptidase/D-esterase-like protein
MSDLAAAGPASPGPRNSLTDVAGLLVGNAWDEAVATGVTVVLAEASATAAVDVCGGAPGTREAHALKPGGLVGAVDAVVLSGGSVYGLGAADAVTASLGAMGRGYRLRDGVMPAPIVAGAILFDLANGGDKDWGEAPPYARLGREALAAAGPDFALGSVGAGRGAMAGTLEGGLGSASAVTADGITVAALAAVTSLGSVVAPDGRSFWAAPWEIDGEFGGGGPAGLRALPDSWPHAKLDPGARENTTLCVVATDCALSNIEAERVAVMARAGLARAIRPVFAPFDGDVIFSLATGRVAAPVPRAVTVARIGALAADCLARAVARGVFEAGRDG